VRAGAGRAGAEALSREIRAVVEALAACDIDPEDVTAATELARALRRRLEGPRRPRWYDAGDHAMAFGPASRDAYRDQSPIRGRLNPVAPPLRVEAAERDDGAPAVRGRVRMGLAYEGPPHGVHGGWVAALFDDLLGAAQGAAEAACVTARLTVRYRHVTPIEEDLRLEAWIDRDDGRRIIAKATCHAGDTLTADAEGLFIRVDFNEIQDRMRRRRAGTG
jgi:acyl-coenzyme A thioesterase PaaI-like protein